MRHALAILTLTTFPLTACNVMQNLGGSTGSSGTTTGTGGTGAAGGQSTSTAAGATGGSGGSGATGGTGGSTGTGGTGGACPAMGSPITVATGQGIPVGIAVDTDQIYWVTQKGKGAIWKAAKSGGDPAAVLDGNTKPGLANYDPTWQPVSLAVDGGSLYWTTVALGKGGLWTMPAGGGMPAKQATTGIDAAWWPQDLFVIEGTAFWGGYLNDNIYDATIFSLAGGALEAREVQSLGSYAAALVVDASHVYFSVTQAGNPAAVIARLPLAGGTPEKLADSAGSPGLAIDTDHVYFGTVTDKPSLTGSIRRVPKAGGAAETLATGSFGVFSMVVDDSTVYFTDYDAPCGAVRSVPKTGGDVTVIASGQDFPLGIAQDDAFVYWTNRSSNDGGSVMKAAK